MSQSTRNVTVQTSMLDLEYKEREFKLEKEIAEFRLKQKHKEIEIKQKSDEVEFNQNIKLRLIQALDDNNYRKANYLKQYLSNSRNYCDSTRHDITEIHDNIYENDTSDLYSVDGDFTNHDTTLQIKLRESLDNTEANNIVNNDSNITNTENSDANNTDGINHDDQNDLDNQMASTSSSTSSSTGPHSSNFASLKPPLKHYRAFFNKNKNQFAFKHLICSSDKFSHRSVFALFRKECYHTKANNCHIYDDHIHVILAAHHKFRFDNLHAFFRSKRIGVKCYGISKIRNDVEFDDLINRFQMEKYSS